MADPVRPGDVVINGWNCMKGRPWIVLWIDDDEDIACLVACTSQAGYVGAIQTGSREQPFAGAWVMLQPMSMVRKSRRVGNVNKAVRRRLARELHRNLDLIGD